MPPLRRGRRGKPRLYEGRGVGLVCQFVLAGGAAGFAVHKAVGAEAHFELRLAVHAEFFALATRFRPLALGANDVANARFRRHGWSLVRQRPGRNVTEVTEAGLGSKV